MSAPEKIWIDTDGYWSGFDPSEIRTVVGEYTRTDLSQAAVAAALEAAAVKSDDMATEWGKKREAAWRKKNATEEARVFDGMSLAALTVADAIRDLIAPAQHDALAAHVAAEVAKARAEDAAKIANLVELIEASGAMPEGFCCCSKDRIGDDSKIHEHECRDLRNALAQIGAKP